MVYAIMKNSPKTVLSRMKIANITRTEGILQKTEIQLPKILFLDIETAPNTATVWDIWNQNIAISQLLESSYVMCWSAKWKHDNKVMFDSVEKSGKEGVVRSIWELLDQADIVIHYNGRKFDIPTLKKEFLLLKLPPPSPYKQVDLYQTVRKEFRFVSNKLDYILKQLGYSGKIKTTHELWLKCMNHDPAAWKKMELYNRGDTEKLSKVYKRLLPWIKNHPNYGLFSDPSRPVCSNCGSHKVYSRGLYLSKTLTYKRYACKSCGTWMKSSLSERKLNNKKMLTQVMEI
jgi:DNA polymerase elongation subunit (family B)